MHILQMHKCFAVCDLQLPLFIEKQNCVFAFLKLRWVQNLQLRIMPFDLEQCLAWNLTLHAVDMTL